MILKITFIVSIALLIQGCNNSYYIIKPAGELNMVSTRNYETKIEYAELKTYAGVDRSQIDNAIALAKGGKIKKKSPAYKEINTFKAENLSESVDAVVKSVSGGEYLTNVKIYSIYQFTGRQLIPISFYMASGDVWGTKLNDDNIKGFKKDDKVVFTFTKELKNSLSRIFNGKVNTQYFGKILELKSATAMIIMESGEIIEIPYLNLVKL